jgi:hypothetical protein
LLSPKIEIIQSIVELIGPDPVQKEKNMYRIKIGVANTGFLPTNVSEMATKVKAVLPLMIEISTNNEKILQVSYNFIINMFIYSILMPFGRFILFVWRMIFMRLILQFI